MAAKVRHDLLDSWEQLNKQIGTLSEEELRLLLREEASGRKRAAVTMRLHGRYNRLRQQRERSELLGGRFTL